MINELQSSQNGDVVYYLLSQNQSNSNYETEWISVSKILLQILLFGLISNNPENLQL